MNAGQHLPAGFEALEPFVAEWALATTAARAERRSTSSPEARETFYAAAMPLLAPALAYLDSCPLADLGDGERCLMNLMMSLAHVSLAVEVHRDMEPQHAAARAAMPITRSATDRS